MKIIRKDCSYFAIFIEQLNVCSLRQKISQVMLYLIRLEKFHNCFKNISLEGNKPHL